ncbi:hypothetical protein TNCV_2252341 [Trichonephila clavipes]|nr:hypothetical protein TNCV_2252341 [Trichonephila clavipes]
MMKTMPGLALHSPNFHIMPTLGFRVTKDLIGLNLSARVFSSIVREFLELFYNLWRTVLAKNKIVLDPALRLQSFRTPKTQQLVSEVGLNANNKSDGGPVPDSSRKIDRQHECQYGRNEIPELTGMNANMGEMKST